MQWFKRAQRKDIWDEALEAPVGDIEAAKRIRQICRSATNSAEIVGASVERANAKMQNEVERYERAARAAMEVAMQISDGLIRDAAVRQIVELCLKAANLTTAQTLLRAIQSKSIREETLRDYPQLQP